jgi:hypothetical protein
MALGLNWNWIAYLPQEEMDVNDALSSLSAGSGITIKTNNTSAQYLASTGQWMPAITMYPNKGYKIKMAIEDTLIYPESARMNEAKQVSRNDVPDWYVPNGFEESMSIACCVSINGQGENDGANLIGAFVDGEIRGVSNGGFFDVGGGIIDYFSLFGIQRVCLI